MTGVLLFSEWTFFRHLNVYSLFEKESGYYSEEIKLFLNLTERSYVKWKVFLLTVAEINTEKELIRLCVSTFIFISTMMIRVIKFLMNKKEMCGRAYYWYNTSCVRKKGPGQWFYPVCHVYLHTMSHSLTPSHFSFIVPCEIFIFSSDEVWF